MKHGWRWTGAVLLVGALGWVGCGGDDGDTRGVDDPAPVEDPQENPQVPDAGTQRPDAGSGTDAGTGGTDAGTGGTDAGTGGTDAGTGGTDAGTDAGTPPETVQTYPLPSAPGWTFYNQELGAPRYIYGITADQGGNIWVAGGEEGLFLMKKGQTTLQRFTMSDGLHPFGRMRDGVGGPPPGMPYLKVISVAGGPSGTVFVGYAGKPPAPGRPTCEDEWDQSEKEGRPADASVYKSGDADKVTLKADGTLDVVHYDIHTGPTKVGAELRGREKLCTIYRIAYDPVKEVVWFGGNHGFAMGDAKFDGNVPAYCWDPRPWNTTESPKFKWEFECAGLYEHVHPHISGSKGELLSDRYYGIAITDNHDVFFGGQIRSTRFYYMTLSPDQQQGNYWDAQAYTEDKGYDWNRFDIWADQVPDYPSEAQRVDDNVSGMAMAGNGDVWVSSFFYGLARLNPQGQVQTKVMQDLVNYSPARGSTPAMAPTSAVATDPLDGSLWVGANWWGGITRLKGGGTVKYSADVFGTAVTSVSAVSDIQFDRSGGKRRVLMSFEGVKNPKTGVVTPGLIGIYEGD
ncbi:hypothetical protein [Corallococcus llansteffanensis]|uniref:Uncharacterized protein n=1 Tax=Corallococcus llansteffanensis TaxID=2316731 RepID=A0A3A8PD56_9BACT|nr:hypothetical protein [Corallococcus llansteffanensis]RKH54338.1 hypothetical protein D7V93_25700 [Corallococcus llansteffanensis]